jgi:hypothetical protein
MAAPPQGTHDLTPIPSSCDIRLSRHLRTIQKRVPVAKAAYCSMVDRTLKMRHTSTMRKLQDRVARQSASHHCHPGPTRDVPNQVSQG